MILKMVGLENTVSFNENSVVILNVRNINLFSRLVHELYYASKNIIDNNEVKIINDIHEIDLNKDALFIDNIFELNLNNKNILNKLYGEIERIMHDYHYKSLLDQNIAEINNIIFELSTHIDLNLTWQNEIKINNLLKLFEIKLEVSEEQTIIENLYSIIDLNSEFNLYKIIICINLSKYIEESKLKEIYKYCNYKKTKILVVESGIIDKKYGQENVLIIDKDFDDYTL